MLSADLAPSAPTLIKAMDQRIALINPSSQVVMTVTPATAISTNVKKAFSGKGLLIMGGLGFLGLLAFLLFSPKKKPSAPVAGWFRRRRR